MSFSLTPNGRGNIDKEFEVPSPTEATPGQIVAGLVVLMLFLSSPAMFIWLVIRRVQGETIVPFEPRRRPRIGMFELGAGILLFFLTVGAVYWALPNLFGISPDLEISDLSPNEFLIVVFTNLLAFVAGCVGMFAMLLIRGGSPVDLGITVKKAGSDVGLGIGAFLLMGGFVYGMQAILFQLFPQQHPLLELISANPKPQYFIGAFISAGIMAPIYEEVIFRGGLQGWLERHLLGRGETVVHEVENEGIIVASPADETESTNPYVAPRTESEERVEGDEVQQSAAVKIAWLPIVISSLIFAGMHLGQGPAPIPLFFLAICLGYLYQRTHRLLPCITLHACLNLTSLVMLWFSVG